MLRLRLEVEQLEDRVTPSAVGPVAGGTPWVSPDRLTLSFVPDATLVNSAGSNLIQTLDSQFTTGSWRLEMLRAVQTWAVNGNVNIGLVADGGQPLGSAGLIQGDSHFGDLRIAAQAGSINTVATGTPFRLDGSTWSGDVVLNSNYHFRIGGGAGTYDLYSVFLHETGHAFGMTDNDSAISAMFGTYNGVRSGLSVQDVTDFQALYGTRSPDAFDAKQSNDTLKYATSLDANSTAVRADISNVNDLDYYSFKAPGNLSAGAPLYFHVRTSGISLLVPSLTVYDASGKALGTLNASSPLDGDLAFKITNPKAGATYYARVGNATRSVFGIGAYQLSVGTDAAQPAAAGLVLNDPEHGSNDSIKTATKLNAKNSGGTRLTYALQASISDAGDVDFYRVHSSAAATSANQELIAVVTSTDLNGLAPRVDVFDASGKLVPSQVLGNDHGFYSVQVLNVTPDADYYVKVGALAPNGRHNSGNYFLGVNFSQNQTVTAQSFASGILTPSSPQQVQGVTIGRSEAVQFILNADATGATDAAQVQMLIYDVNNNVVFALVAYAGQPASSGVAYLAAGAYHIAYVAVARSGTLTSALSYGLKGILLSDPIGPQPVSSSDPLPPLPDPFTWTDPSYLSLQILYGYIDPYYE